MTQMNLSMKQERLRDREQACGCQGEKIGKDKIGVWLPRQLSWQRIRMQFRRPWFNSWVRKICWRRNRLLTPVFLGFPGGSPGKESICNMGDLGSIPVLGRPTGEGNGYPLQYSGLENSIDCKVHRVAKSRTRLRDLHVHFHIQQAFLGQRW